jgi:hypothetical protein
LKLAGERLQCRGPLATSTGVRSFAAIALACVAACSPGPSAGGERAVLDRSSTPYLEDEGTGRVLADVRAELVRDGDSARLLLALSAEGPRVDPVPGIAGVRGSNRITARELGRIDVERALRVETRELGRDASVLGESHVARRGAVPERRVDRDGSLDADALGTSDAVLELAVDSGSLGPGEHEMRLWVDGRERLLVRFSFDGSRGRIDSIESLPRPQGMHP